MVNAVVGEVHDLKAIDPKTIPHVLMEGELGAALEWMVWDPQKKAAGLPESKYVTEHVIKRSESFVQQFLQMLWITMVQKSTAGLVVKDTGNVNRSVYLPYTTSAYGYHLGTNGGASSVTLGIVVGTNNTAPTISDYALGTQILHDAAPPTAGRLQYSAVSYGAPVADATTSQLTITRNFANGSGGAITVEEVGLYCFGYAAGAQSFLIIRDVTGGIAVPNGQTLTINYRPQGVV